MKDYGFPSGSSTEVKSSNIRKLHRDKDKKKLRVEFNSGAVYEYDNVNDEVYNFLIGGATSQDGTSGSIGAAFHLAIRNRPYIHPYKRIDNE